MLQTVNSHDFGEFNSTSISHLLITLSGYNGQEAHDLALPILNDYYNWYVGRSMGLWQLWNNPRRRMFEMPYTWELRGWIDATEQLFQTHGHLCKPELLKKFEELHKDTK